MLTLLRETCRSAKFAVYVHKTSLRSRDVCISLNMLYLNQENFQWEEGHTRLKETKRTKLKKNFQMRDPSLVCTGLKKNYRTYFGV